RHLALGAGEDARPVEEVRPVLVHAGRPGDDVLVHQGGPEGGGGDGSERGGDGRRGDGVRSLGAWMGRREGEHRGRVWRGRGGGRWKEGAPKRGGGQRMRPANPTARTGGNRRTNITPPAMRARAALAQSCTPVRARV